MCSFQNYTCLIKFFWMQFNVIPRTIVSQKCSQAQISNSPSIKYSSNVFHERSLIGTFAQQVTTCVRNDFKPVAAEAGFMFQEKPVHIFCVIERYKSQTFPQYKTL